MNANAKSSLVKPRLRRLPVGKLQPTLECCSPTRPRQQQIDAQRAPSGTRENIMKRDLAIEFMEHSAQTKGKHEAGKKTQKKVKQKQHKQKPHRERLAVGEKQRTKPPSCLKKN
jgi:hypothetical protein